MTNLIQNKFRTYLDREGVKLGAFAKKLEISQSYASELLSGARYPSLPLAHQIEALTKGAVPMNYWLDETSQYKARQTA